MHSHTKTPPETLQEINQTCNVTYLQRKQKKMHEKRNYHTRKQQKDQQHCHKPKFFFTSNSLITFFTTRYSIRVNLES